MLSLFFKYPIITGIAIVLTVMLTSAVRGENPRLGEILGTQMVSPLMVFGIVAILCTMLAIGKAFLPKEVKRKKRARALKARNNKD